MDKDVMHKTTTYGKERLIEQLSKYKNINNDKRYEDRIKRTKNNVYRNSQNQN